MNNPGSHNPWNSNCTDTYLRSQKPSKENERDMQYTAEEARTNS